MSTQKLNRIFYKYFSKNKKKLIAFHIFCKKIKLHFKRNI